MNEQEIRQLEKLLQGLSLREPSAELDRRVAALGPPAVRRRQVSTLRERFSRRGLRRAAWAAAALLAAAATLLIAIHLNRPAAPHGPAAQPSALAHVSPPVRPAEVSPVQIERLWSVPVSHELVPPATEGGAPVSRVQQQVVRHVEWIDEQQGVYLQWTMPGEEVTEQGVEKNALEYN